jgi:arsenite methyltransferase
MDNDKIRDQVVEYYGRILEGSADLKTDACCTTDMPAAMRALLADVHEEVLARYYGCGLVHPELMRGLRVLDLGCGSGRDVYVLSRLVGPRGFVAGVDMTEEQLAVAQRHVDYHTEKYGYDEPNVAFHKGYIERLDALDLEDESFDVVVSNCVINLSPDKESVLREVYRVLRPGGELYFSDVYADRRLPPQLMADPILHGECLAGALYKADFIRLARRFGFADPRVVTARPLAIDNPGIRALLGPVRFESITYRLFKIDGLEDACEDYGQAVRYKGTIPDLPDAFDLDDHHHFETGRAALVCGNTHLMLAATRFAEHFEYFGDMDHHYGAFLDCGSPAPSTAAAGGDGGADGGSCC